MPISLTLTPFDHFQNMSSSGIGPDLILTLCLTKEISFNLKKSVKFKYDITRCVHTLPRPKVF